MGSRNERFHGKMRGKTVRGRGYVKFPMNDGAMETVECMWVDIWCMLDWIIGLCHKTAEMHFPGMSCSTSCKNINIRRPNIRKPNMVKRGLMYSKKN